MPLDSQKVYGAKWVQIDDCSYYWIYERGMSPPSSYGRLPIARHVVPASSTNLKAYTARKYVETLAITSGVIANIDSAVDLRDSMPMDITVQDAEPKNPIDVCLSLSSIQQQSTSEFTSIVKSIDSAVLPTEAFEFLEASDKSPDQINSICTLSHKKHSTLIDASGSGKEHTTHATGECLVHNNPSLELEELTKSSLPLLTEFAAPVVVDIDDRSLAEFQSVTNIPISNQQEEISVPVVDETLSQERVVSKDNYLPAALRFELPSGSEKVINESFDSKDNGSAPVPPVTEQHSSTKGSIDNLVNPGEVKASMEGLSPTKLDSHEAPAGVYAHNSSDDYILDIPTTLQNVHGLSYTKSEAVVSWIRSDRSPSLLASYSRHDNVGVPDLVLSNDSDTDGGEEPNSPSSAESYKKSSYPIDVVVENSCAPNKETVSASAEKNSGFAISNISGVDETPSLSDEDTSSSVLDCPTVKISVPTLCRKEYTLGGDLGCDNTQDLTPESMHGAHRNDLTANVYTSTGSSCLSTSLESENRREINNFNDEELTIEELAVKSVAFEEHALKKRAIEEVIVDKPTVSESGVNAHCIAESSIETSCTGPL